MAIAEFIERHSRLALFFIILLGAILRFYSLTSVPPSLYWDEVSLGYNAYSIAETGRGEHGMWFPLVFQAYDDYKFPGYIYLAAVPIKLFGLSEFTTRLPNAALGTLSILFVFFLGKNVFQKFPSTKKYATRVAILASFLFAISPWSTSLSRAAFEANTALAFVILGFALLLSATRQKLYMALGLIALLVAIDTYRSELVFVPLMLLCTLTIFFSDFFSRQRKTATIILLLLFASLAAPIYNQTFFGDAAVRQNQVSIVEKVEDKMESYSRKITATDSESIGKIFLNYKFAYANVFLSNYAKNFSPDFLFLSGDSNPRHGAPNMGVLYLWEAISILFGLLFLTKVHKKVGLFIISWVLLGPLAAALATPSPHALRALNILPGLTLLSAIGIYYIFESVKKWKSALLLVSAGVLVFFFARFAYLYFEVMPPSTSNEWGGGYERLVNYVRHNEDDYEKIAITGHYWNPYMYFLFYDKYDPAEFQEKGTVRGFGNFVFGGTSWDKDRYSTTLSSIDLVEFTGSQNAMIVLSPDEFDSQRENVHEITRVRDTTENVTFVITELN